MRRKAKAEEKRQRKLERRKAKAQAKKQSGVSHESQS
jgi:hypothetical protein